MSKARPAIRSLVPNYMVPLGNNLFTTQILYVFESGLGVYKEIFIEIKRLVGVPSCGSESLPSGPDLLQVEPSVLIVNSYIRRVTRACPRVFF